MQELVLEAGLGTSLLALIIPHLCIRVYSNITYIGTNTIIGIEHKLNYETEIYNNTSLLLPLGHISINNLA